MSTHVADLLGAWALDVCGDGEAATVEAHLGQCDECSSEAARLRAAAAAGLLGVERVITPPVTLRQSVLDEARRRRAPVTIHTLVESYSAQAALLHEALGGLDRSGWQRADPRHGDVAGVIRHLTANDAILAGALDLPRVPPASGGGSAAHEAWRLQSEILLRGLGSGSVKDLDRLVPMAGKAARPGPLRDALVQRAFETWIHLEDVRCVMVPPSPERVRRIVALAVGLLPQVLAAQGFRWPGTFRLRLRGPGSGEWSFPLGGGAEPAGGTVVTMEALEFTHLVANRRTAETVNAAVEGDGRVAFQVLRIASMLGCD